MKVAFVVWEFPVLSETFILNQAIGLIERGHEVDIYAYGSQQSDTAKVHADVEKYHLLDRTYSIPAHSPTIPSNYLLRFLKGLWLIATNFHKAPRGLMRSLNVFKYKRQAASLRLLYKAIPFLSHQSYDIIHCQFGTLGLAVLPFYQLGLLKGKLVISFRGYDISQHLQTKGDDVYDQLLKTGNLFLTNCEFFKRRLISIQSPEEKVIVHRSGLNCSRFIFTGRKAPIDGPVRITTIGRLVEKKGIEYGIRAVAKLVLFHPNLEYLIIGDGPSRQSLAQLIQELKVSSVVKLLGWKEQQEIIEILNDSHIFIGPSVTATDGNQDAPVNTLKEAMAMGLPVIGTQHGGIPELIEEGVSGFLVPERDADAIAEKLSWLMEHPNVWHQMGQAGRNCVEQHYDLCKLNDQLVEIYHRLVNPEGCLEQTQAKVVALANI